MGVLAKIFPAAVKRWLLASLGNDREDMSARIFHASPDWIVILRVSDGLILDANLGFQAISGFRPAEVVGHLISEFHIWVDPQQRKVLIQEMLRDGVARDRLVQLRRRDGAVRDCMVNAALIAFQESTPSHAVWIARDVTEQNAIHEQFTIAFQLTPDSMSITRMRDGRYVEVNAAMEQSVGLSRAEIVGKTSMDVGIWADPSQRAALVELLKVQPTVRDFFALIRTRNQVVREKLLNAAVFEAQGERYIVSLTRDVTEARKAAQALQDSEARFSLLFEKSPMPMCYIGDVLNSGDTQWNLAWFDAFGYNAATAQGKSGLVLNFWVNPQDRADLLATSAHNESGCDMEAQLRCANGELRWVWVSIRVIKQGQRVMYVSSFFDITQRRQAQEQVLQLNTELEARVTHRTAELQRANQELREALATLQRAQDQLVQSEKLAALGSLVAGVAHELNTPIGNGLTVASALEHRVQQFAQIMVTGLRRSDLQNFVDDARTAADIVVRNLTRAGALVTGFKQVAVDQASSNRRQFSLAVVVAEILVMLNPTIRQSACTVVSDIPPGLELDSYPGPLGQVLTNLVNNALLHGFGSNRAGRVSVRAWVDFADAQAVVEVQDEGEGIAVEDLHRVFEPFFTTRLGQGGSGLGLHIVHNIVTGVLGGSIDVRSALGQGATFTMRLPVSAPQRSDSAGGAGT